MRQKTLYTCEVCHTDYTDPDKATECENKHVLAESVGSYKFGPYDTYPRPCTDQIQERETDRV